MSKILGAKFNVYTILGLLVIAATLLFGLWKIADTYLDKKYIKPATVDDIRAIYNERYLREDSMNSINDLRFMRLIQNLRQENKEKDSLINYFYNETSKRYNDKINGVDSYTNNELLRTWANRYGQR